MTAARFLALLVVCLAIVGTLERADAETATRPTYAQAPKPPKRIESALRLAAIAYGVSYQTLRRRAWCESRYNPRAVGRVPVWNGERARGLMQFLKSTWRSTPYRARNIYNPYANALAAAWMIRAGRGGEWACR